MIFYLQVCNTFGFGKLMSVTDPSIRWPFYLKCRSYILNEWMDKANNEQEGDLCVITAEKSYVKWQYGPLNKQTRTHKLLHTNRCTAVREKQKTIQCILELATFVLSYRKSEELPSFIIFNEQINFWFEPYILLYICIMFSNLHEWCKCMLIENNEVWKLLTFLTA